MSNTDNLIAEMMQFTKFAGDEEVGSLSPAQGGVLGREMDDGTFEEQNPLEENYDEGVSSAHFVGDKKDDVFKTASDVANEILSEVAGVIPEEEEDEEVIVNALVDAIKEKDDTIDILQSKEAGIRAVFSLLGDPNGAAKLHKVASQVDPDYVDIQGHLTRTKLANDAAQGSYILGAEMAKIAIDKAVSALPEVQAVVSKLVETQAISQETAQVLMQKFSQLPEITRESIMSVVNQMPNNQVLVQAFSGGSPAPDPEQQLAKAAAAVRDLAMAVKATKRRG